MGFSINDAHVEALLYNSNGKWKYTVCLDYSNMGRDAYEHWDLWTNAQIALAKATAKNISGVSLTKVPSGWMLVVPEPMGKYRHPIMVIGKDGGHVVKEWMKGE